MMEMPPTDKCELCGNSRAFHKNKERDKRAGFHAFVPSARAQDALDDRGRALSQESLASTLSAKPSDLLTALRTKRSELSAALELYKARPDIHFFAFVPELARALDGMIAGVEAAEALANDAHRYRDTSARWHCDLVRDRAKDIVRLAANAWRGGDDGKD